jgi:subtilase family serine protease
MMRVRFLAPLPLVAAIALVATFARHSSSPPPSHGLRLIGPAPAADHVAFALELRLRRPDRLRARLSAIEDPRSPFFGTFISAGSFGKSFGISTAQEAGLERRLRAAGLRPGGAGPQRTQLTVDGSVSAVNRFLGTRLVDYADAAGRRYRAPLSTPRIPSALGGDVDAIIGLDERPRWVAHDVPIGGLTPTMAAAAYDVAPLHRAGFDGQGQTIALISFSAFDPHDPVAFARHYGLSGPGPQVIPVQGGTSDTSSYQEDNLDIDIIREIAPAARILVYESNSSTATVIHQIVSHHRANVISSSWGDCEKGLDPGERRADSRELATAAAADISMFVGTGDKGAYDCQSISPSDHHLTVDWPSASANAVAVGGTRLYITPAGSYLGETAWEDQLSNWGGGGGFSIGEPRPSWQSAPGVLNRFSDGHRELPDVSAAADPGTPWSFYAGGRLLPTGNGTSAAAPFWAASMALIDQYAARHGIRRVPYINPILYALASSRQRYAPFHDVVTGANRYYPAGPGWDPATGLGSPDVYNLARDIVHYLHSLKARH